MEEPARQVTNDELHGTYLERSRKDLQTKLEQLKRALAQENEKLAIVTKAQQGRSSLSSVSAIGSKCQLDAVAEAYKEVAASEPFLPFPDSVLPALIALRTTNTIINDSRKFLAGQKSSLDEAQGRLDAENASLASQKALTLALKNRIESLRDCIETRKAMSSSQVMLEKISDLHKQIKDTDADTSKLQDTLKKFIDESLSAMLAAEEIGGPVAGDMMDVDSDNLETGFTATGKRKKSKADASPDKKQRRIDAMFSRAGVDVGDGPEPNKRTAAKDDLQELVAQLMHKLMAAGGSSTDAYISIPGESASVRFLVRAKVAEFHPRDSKRLRLVDFGRAIEE